MAKKEKKGGLYDLAQRKQIKDTFAKQSADRLLKFLEALSKVERNIDLYIINALGGAAALIDDLENTKEIVKQIIHTKIEEIKADPIKYVNEKHENAPSQITLLGADADEHIPDLYTIKDLDSFLNNLTQHPEGKFIRWLLDELREQAPEIPDYINYLRISRAYTLLKEILQEETIERLQRELEEERAKTAEEFKISPYFAMPSHDIMFTLLALFAGKPEKIPRKLLLKPYHDRTEFEQKQAEEFLNSIIQKESKVTGHNERGEEIKEDKFIALVSDNPKIEAKANIPPLFKNLLSSREEGLAIYIKRAFGAEGLRHLIGLIIGLEENYRSGYLDWDVNTHLKRLGYKKQMAGAYRQEAKHMAVDMVLTISSLSITARRKDKQGKDIIELDKFFNLEGLTGEEETKEIKKLKMSATQYWYRNAFELKKGRARQYTKLLKKIAQENHRHHPLTIYLAPLLAIFWRQSPDYYKLSITSIMDWCNLDWSSKNRNRMRELRDLEGELNYMKAQGYLGNWENKGRDCIPSECQDPFGERYGNKPCVLILIPPDGLKKELLEIAKKKEAFLAEGEQEENLLTVDELERLLHNTGLTTKQFANNVGITPQMLNYMRKGKRRISSKVDAQIRDAFGHMLPV